MSNGAADFRLTISCWDLCELSEHDLNTWDIAALNLAAAQGLPGLDAVNVGACFDKLDDWAQRVKVEMLRHMYRFDQPPTEYAYGNSFGRFCCYFMLQVLQQDCGVAYNPARKFDPEFGDPADVFVHGILDDNGAGGTCASMPIVYVAVGRRLGFPVNLVQTKEHLFFRWEDPRGTLIQWEQPKTEFWIPPDRFNVEGAGEGIAFYPDSHYIQWPHLWKKSDFEHKCYLRSLSTKEELADFLIQRAECLHELGKRDDCLKAIYDARQLAPADPRYEWLHAKRTKEVLEHQAAMLEIVEMQHERRAARQPLLGVDGHPRNCCCLLCEELRDFAQSLPVAPHGGSCQCRQCMITREAAAAPRGMAGHSPNCQCAGCLHERTICQSPLIPPHGPSCQCRQCQTAREAAERVVVMPGHPPSCQCAACIHQRALPQSVSPHFLHVRRNKPSNARITDTSFCASAEHRSAKTGRTTRILTTQGES